MKLVEKIRRFFYLHCGKFLLDCYEPNKCGLTNLYNLSEYPSLVCLCCGTCKLATYCRNKKII